MDVFLGDWTGISPCCATSISVAFRHGCFQNWSLLLPSYGHQIILKKPEKIEPQDWGIYYIYDYICTYIYIYICIYIYIYIYIRYTYTHHNYPTFSDTAMSDFNGAFRFYPGIPASTAQVLQKVTHREDDDRRERTWGEPVHSWSILGSLKWGIPQNMSFNIELVEF